MFSRRLKTLLTKSPASERGSKKNSFDAGRDGSGKSRKANLERLRQPSIMQRDPVNIAKQAILRPQSSNAVKTQVVVKPKPVEKIGVHRASSLMTVVDDISNPEESQQEVEKEFDEEEFSKYAEYLGVDPTYDSDLLHIVEQAWNAPLPSGWTEHVSPDGSVFYYHEESDTSQWVHPMDEKYRDYIADLITNDEDTHYNQAVSRMIEGVIDDGINVEVPSVDTRPSSATDSRPASFTDLRGVASTDNNHYNRNRTGLALLGVEKQGSNVLDEGGGDVLGSSRSPKVRQNLLLEGLDEDSGSVSYALPGTQRSDMASMVGSHDSRAFYAHNNSNSDHLSIHTSTIAASAMMNNHIEPVYSSLLPSGSDDEHLRPRSPKLMKKNMLLDGIVVNDEDDDDVNVTPYVIPTSSVVSAASKSARGSSREGRLFAGANTLPSISADGPRPGSAAHSSRVGTPLRVGTSSRVGTPSGGRRPVTPIMLIGPDPVSSTIPPLSGGKSSGRRRPSAKSNRVCPSAAEDENAQEDPLFSQSQEGGCKPQHAIAWEGPDVLGNRIGPLVS